MIDDMDAQESLSKALEYYSEKITRMHSGYLGILHIHHAIPEWHNTTIV